MSGEKFHLGLTGRPLEGYRTEAVAADLARLLRIPRKQARNLLRGTPSRIKREFEKEKAVHLMGKIIACGAQCEVTPSEIMDDDSPAIEANIELTDNLELEIDQPQMELETIPVEAGTEGQMDPVSENLDPLQTGSHADRALPDMSPVARSGSDQPVQSRKTKATEGGGSSGSIVDRKRRVLLFAAAVVVLLGLTAWAALSFLGGSVPMSQKNVAHESPVREVVPKIDSEMEKTRQRLELLASSVRIWMIQFGAGFDPSQVTMDRLQQDLGISRDDMEDGWGTRLRYTSAAESYVVTSAGPDRTFGSDDDIKLEKPAR